MQCALCRGGGVKHVQVHVQIDLGSIRCGCMCSVTHTTIKLTVTVMNFCCEKETDCHMSELQSLDYHTCAWLFMMLENIHDYTVYVCTAIGMSMKSVTINITVYTKPTYFNLTRNYLHSLYKNDCNNISVYFRLLHTYPRFKILVIPCRACAARDTVIVLSVC